MAFNLALKSKTAEASFSISRDNLARFINAVRSIIPKKTTIQILKYVRIAYKDNGGFIRVPDTSIASFLFLDQASSRSFIDTRYSQKSGQEDATL